jgi:hypothetical protein
MDGSPSPSRSSSRIEVDRILYEDARYLPSDSRRHLPQALRGAVVRAARRRLCCVARDRVREGTGYPTVRHRISRAHAVSRLSRVAVATSSS